MLLIFLSSFFSLPLLRMPLLQLTIALHSHIYICMYDCVRVYVCISLLNVFVCLFVFLNFDGNETLIKIHIIRFALHPTNVFSPWIIWFSHSFTGMLGIGNQRKPSSFSKVGSKTSFFFLFFFSLIHIPKLSILSLSLCHPSVPFPFYVT